MKKVCLYHSADLDGKCSGAIVKKIYPNCQLYGIDYGQPCPWDLIKDKTVIIVDFSFPIETMIKLNQISDLIWIDHHISAIKELEKSGVKIKGLRNTAKAACGLAWVYFQKPPTPKTVKMLGAYDRGDLSDPLTLPFQYGMRQFNTDPENQELWSDMFKDIRFAEIYKQGQNILQYVRRHDEKFSHAYCFEITFEGLRCVVLNRQPLNSKVFDSVWDENKHDLMIGFAKRQDVWQVSLYTTKDIDVSEIAQRHGGGGHKKAAGFVCKELPFTI